MLKEYNIAFVVREWRKNSNGNYQQIGFVLRDMQVLVKFGVVGMNDHQNSEFANIYPNPFKQVFEVDIQGAGGHVVNCLLYGTDGRLVVTKVERVDQKIILDAGSIEAGIYLLQIRTESGVWYKKIIKE